jgi:enamine deaminase RidA (YjgF/YER057c/UK114 family)
MSIEFKDPVEAPPPAGNYRNLAIVAAGKRLLIISGQIGNRLDGTIIEGLEAQYEQALSNINAIVASEGGTAIDIAKITIFLTEEPSARGLIGEANRKHFPDGPPAMSWIRVAGLFRPEVKVEVEALAAVD